jgi:bifunctional oligoribonuclease and PAP phosphatase NrnA
VSILTEIARTINGSSRVFLATHVNPDGDAIGSLLGLNCLLMGLGKDVTAFIADPIPGNFRFLPASDRVINTLSDHKGRSFDLAIVVDSTDWERTGTDIPSIVRLDTVINIDHHVSNNSFGDINYIDPKASAVGEMLYDVIGALGAEVDARVAACLYTAIITDTGSFTYSNTTARAFEISEKLVRCGARPAKIAEEINENYSVSRLELLRLALFSLEFTGNRRIGSMTITQEMFRETGTGPDMIEGFIDYPRFVAGVKVAVLFRELPSGGYKVSFRSRDSLDVSRIAGHFGGGGHVNASGCTVPGDLSRVKDDVISVTQRVLEETIDEGR